VRKLRQILIGSFEANLGGNLVGELGRGAWQGSLAGELGREF